MAGLTGEGSSTPDSAAEDGADQEAARFRVLVQVADELLAAVGDAPALVVVATVRRPDSADPTHLDETLADLARHREAVRLTLRGLSETDVAALVANLTGQDGKAIAPVLHDRTGGNPFFCSELLKLLQSESPIDGVRASTASVEIPATVRDVVDRRAARLPEDTRTMLRLAAVAGPSVELAVLEHCSGLDADRVADLLEPAVLTGLLLEVTDGLGWRFPHGIVQEAIRASLSRVQQARLHAAVAVAISEVHRGHLDLHLDELAHHSWAGARVSGAHEAMRWAVACLLYTSPSPRD